MSSGNTVFKGLESTDEVPPYLKHALMSEVNTIRDTMHIIEHFTGHFFDAMMVSFSGEDKEL